jgi:KaiC domain protein
VSDEEEDWFERAMREAEEAEEDDLPRATADADSESETGDDGESDTDAGTDDATDADSTAETPPADEPGGSDDPFGGSQRSAGGDDPFGGGNGDDTADTTDAPDAGASDPFGGNQGSTEGGDPFGGNAGGGDPFGGGEGFGGDFADRGSGRGGGGFGGEGGFGGDDGFGSEPESFDEAELDSDIDRIDVGIEGLDEMILGGVPERSLMVSIGSAGTGKTTFGLQFLTEALENGGRGIYITLEESREAILSTAEEKGWSFREWRNEGRLAIVAMDPIEMANSLSSIRNDISRLVEEFNADRLVLDSVSLLEMMYDHPAERRSEVFDFARSLKRAGVTTMLTSEASSEDAYTSRYGIIEYLVDAVFILQYVRPSDFRETRLAVEIQKIRDANHSRETKPYEITNEGISVYRQANIF